MAQGLTLVADSSAWIAMYRADVSATKTLMKEAIQNHVILVPDLVLVEVLRGLPHTKIFRAIIQEFENFQIVRAGGKEMAVKAAAHYRWLRTKGITIRGTVDLMIATWCIENEVPLLHADRDFASFEEHLGLKRWQMPEQDNN